VRTTQPHKPKTADSLDKFERKTFRSSGILGRKAEGIGEVQNGRQCLTREESMEMEHYVKLTHNLGGKLLNEQASSTSRDDAFPLPWTNVGLRQAYAATSPIPVWGV